MSFSKKKNVRFAHCDPAGIVFYPRYAELCNEIVEDWFREGIGIDFRQLQEELRLSVPAVRLKLEFVAPSVYGDVLDFSLQVREIGSSSFSVSLLARCEGRERVRGELKLVLISLASMRSVKIDSIWRERFAQFCAHEESAAGATA